MKIIRAIDRKESAAAVLSKYAYLVLASDVQGWFQPQADSLIIAQAPDLKLDTFIYRMYTTPASQRYGFDTSGNHDERGIRMKFTGTHPGRTEDALRFVEKFMDLGFIVMIPECGNKTVILGTPDNPLFFSGAHENGSGGRRFTLDFEQEMKDDFVYRLGTFGIEAGTVVGYGDTLKYVLATNAGEAIVFTNNTLIEI